MNVWVHYGAKSLKNSHLNWLIGFWNKIKMVFFIFAILWNVILSQQLWPSSHRSHNSFNANSLNFGLLKNFLAVMKKEVNFEKAKNLVFYEI